MLTRLAPAREVGQRPGGEVVSVAPGSPAAQAGLRPGDRLIGINSLVVRDLIDYTYESSGARLDLELERDGQRWNARVLKERDQDLGIEFRLPVFEGVRECNNNCDFCFIRGLPRGLRRSLYIRDDDYRYSFLFGTFLTLTNLSEKDWQRIGYQRLSPLHVSVHATDLEVRRRMLANPEAPDIVEQIGRLGRMGIEVKAQVVLCPGLNDGAVLEKTVSDLSRLATAVDSVAIVPVGLTRYSVTRNLRQVTPSEARTLIKRAVVWQRGFRERLGRAFVYLSDELYLLAGAGLPAAWRYDGYRQLQNGVGLTRLLMADWARSRSRIPTRVEPPRRVAWVCGRAAGPALRRMAADLERVIDLGVQVVEVANDFFGGGVSVSGLLAGQDVAGKLSGVSADLAILPRAAFGFEGSQTLDGWTIARLESETGLTLALGRTAAELLGLTVTANADIL